MPGEASHFAQETKADEHNQVDQEGALKLPNAVDTKAADEEALANQQEAHELQNYNSCTKKSVKKLQ